MPIWITDPRVHHAHQRDVVLKFRHLILPASATLLAVLPLQAGSQELAAASSAIRLPTAPPALSSECQSKRIAPDKLRQPLKSLSRAVRSKPHVKVLAIGSSSTVGLGASSPTAT